METETNASRHNPADEIAWRDRQRYWQRKLGRLRLGVEPLDEQLAKYRRVTWMLTVVPLGLALMFVALFAAFQRPDVGIVLALILLAPIVALAWLDHAVLNVRAGRYLRELREHQLRITGRTSDSSRASSS
jgi:hypothetical protein